MFYIFPCVFYVKGTRPLPREVFPHAIGAVREFRA